MGDAVLTVLIPTVDRVDSCQRAIESVLAQVEGLPVKLVVSDNASEQSEKLEFLHNLRKSHPNITLLTRTERLRPVEHFREVIEYVDTEFLVLLADDDLFGSDLIPEFFQTLNEFDFDVLKPKWVLSYLGDEHRDSKINFLESRFVSFKLFAFFSSPDDSLFYSIVRTKLLQDHIRIFPDHWSTRVERQIYWAYHPVLYLMCFSRLRNARKPFSTWVNFEGNAKVESKKLADSSFHPSDIAPFVLSGKTNSSFNSLAKLVGFQLYLNRTLVLVSGFRWILACSAGGSWFLIKKSLAKLRSTIHS